MPTSCSASKQAHGPLLPETARIRHRNSELGYLSHLLTFLRGEGAIPAEKISARRLTSAERCTEAQELYMREVRGLAKATKREVVP